MHTTLTLNRKSQSSHSEGHSVVIAIALFASLARRLDGELASLLENRRM